VAKKKHNIKQDLSSSLKKKYGEGIMTTADQIVSREREILTTTLSLDYALGGGIPDGTVCLVSGKEKVGKTSLCLKVLSNAIKAGRPAYYFNVERRCKAELLDTIEDLDKSKLNWVESTPEYTLTAENWLDILSRIIQENPKAVILVDSLAALCTMAEMSDDLDKQKRDMKGVPALLSLFFKRSQQPIDAQDVIVMFITQRMANMGMGGGYTAKSGNAVKYYASAIIQMDWAKKWEEKDGNSPDGHDIQVKIPFAPMGKPYVKCEIPLRFGEGIDTTQDIINMAMELAMIDQAGSWYEYGGEKYQGMTNLRKFFKDNPGKLTKLEQTIRESLFSGSQVA